MSLLTDDAARAAQRAGFAEVVASLSPPHGLPSEAAAREVCAMLAATPPARS